MQNARIIRGSGKCSLNRDVFLVAFSKPTVAAQVAVLVMEAWIVEAPFLLEFQQLAAFLFVQILGLPQLF